MNQHLLVCLHLDDDDGDHSDVNLFRVESREQGQRLADIFNRREQGFTEAMGGYPGGAYVVPIDDIPFADETSEMFEPPEDDEDDGDEAEDQPAPSGSTTIARWTPEQRKRFVREALGPPISRG